MNSIKTNMKFIVSILLLMLIGVSCKSRKHEKKTVQTQAVDTLQAKCKLPFKSARTLSKHIKESELNYNWIVAKADVDVNIDGEDHKFDVKIKSIMLYYKKTEDELLLVFITYYNGGMRTIDVYNKKLIMKKKTICLSNFKDLYDELCHIEILVKFGKIKHKYIVPI